jgi:hypothetical protein
MTAEHGTHRVDHFVVIHARYDSAQPAHIAGEITLQRVIVVPVHQHNTPSLVILKGDENWYTAFMNQTGLDRSMFSVTVKETGVI